QVGIAVADDLVADPVQDQGAAAERFEGRQAFLERGEHPLVVGKESRWDDAVGAEHDREPLLAPLLVGEAQAGKVHDEWEGRRIHSQVAEERTTGTSSSHVDAPRSVGRHQGRWSGKRSERVEKPSERTVRALGSCQGGSWLLPPRAVKAE